MPIAYGEKNEYKPPKAVTKLIEIIVTYIETNRRTGGDLVKINISRIQSQELNPKLTFMIKVTTFMI